MSLHYRLCHLMNFSVLSSFRVFKDFFFFLNIYVLNVGRKTWQVSRFFFSSCICIKVFLLMFYLGELNCQASISSVLEMSVCEWERHGDKLGYGTKRMKKSEEEVLEVLLAKCFFYFLDYFLFLLGVIQILCNDKRGQLSIQSLTSFSRPCLKTQILYYEANKPGLIPCGPLSATNNLKPSCD